MVSFYLGYSPMFDGKFFFEPLPFLAVNITFPELLMFQLFISKSMAGYGHRCISCESIIFQSAKKRNIVTWK
jgi:hypothetical protein